LSEKFRRFVILVSIHQCWIHLSTLSNFAGPLHIIKRLCGNIGLPERTFPDYSDPDTALMHLHLIPEIPGDVRGELLLPELATCSRKGATTCRADRSSYLSLLLLSRSFETSRSSTSTTRRCRAFENIGSRASSTLGSQVLLDRSQPKVATHVAAKKHIYVSIFPRTVDVNINGPHQ
jgi:hypothetical protein